MKRILIPTSRYFFLCRLDFYTSFRTRLPRGTLKTKRYFQDSGGAGGDIEAGLQRGGGGGGGAGEARSSRGAGGEGGKEILFIAKVAESLCLSSKPPFEYLINDQLLLVSGKVIRQIRTRPWEKFRG